MRGLATLARTCVLAALFCDCAASQEDDDLQLGARFVSDRAFRREALEQSLAIRDNGYAQLRLDNYALPAGGWDELPVWNPDVAQATDDSTAFEPIWSGDALRTREDWLALGRRAFAQWPAQSLASSSADGEAIDAVSAARLGFGGLVRVRYPDGNEGLRVSCAGCHGRLRADGTLQHGPASYLDLAALLGIDAAWGPGRLDVTDDGIDNPVAIADLRATRHHRRLHWSGNLHASLLALAVRIDTLLITETSSTVRPPREVAFALALYVWSLGERDDTRDAARLAPRGAALFARNCTRCHAGETGSGDVVAAAVVGTDPAAAESPDRGSGGYRVPSLFRVADRTRLTHEGRFESLDAMFDPTRSDRDSAHPFGLDLDANDREALLDFLRLQ